MNQNIITNTDDRWIYGESWDKHGTKLTEWMKTKHVGWFVHDHKTIVREKIGIPLNDEMMKQITKFEGDTDFLYRLRAMCHNTDDSIDLTEKQINFMARFMLANIDIPVYVLRHFVVGGLKANVPTKEIENKMKEVRERHQK